MDNELRMCGAVAVETRMVEGVEQRVLTGVVMRYEDVGDIGGMFKEKFLPGALSFDRVRINVMHDKAKLLGRVPGNAKIIEVDKEVRVEVPILDTQEHRDAVTNIEAGVLCGWSVEFAKAQSTFVGRTREIRKAELIGIALVDHPVYTATTVTVRDALALEEEATSAAAAKKVPRWMM